MTSNQPHNYLSSGLWKVASCACFAGINGIVRYLNGGSPLEMVDPLPSYVIVFFQNIFGVLALLPWLIGQDMRTFKTNNPGLHFIRVLVAVIGIGIWYISLHYLQIAQVIALGFTGPIITVIGARLILNEHLDWQRMTAIGISFIGAFVIMRPDEVLMGQGDSSMGFAVFLPLIAACCFAASKLCARMLASRGESPKVMTLYILTMMAPVSLIPALFEWQTPSAHHWPWLIAMGVLAKAAHFSLVKAFEHGEVTFVTPFGFSKILIGASVGYLAFGEYPNTWTVWIGAGIIFTSVMLLSMIAEKKQPARKPA
ncbi:MAG: DMT family transporter [Alphaproteobacteria bacterium]